MKILYLTFENHKDVNAWSGMMLNVSRALQNHNSLIFFDNIKLGVFSKIRIAWQLIIDRLTKKKTKYLRISSVMKDITKKIQKRIDCDDFDVVFTMRPHLISYIKTNKPIVVFADCNFQSMINYYESFTGLRKKHIAECNKQEKLAFENCSLALFTSPWAVRTSSENYLISRDKFKCVYIGSNMAIKHSDNEIERFIQNRKKAAQKRILFVGVDWNRKGGDLAVEAIFLLNKMGYDCKLVIVGCNPVINGRYSSFVEVLGRIDKSSEEGMARMDEEYQKAYCFILPTKSECAAVSLAEASAYGLYSFTSNTGGTDGVIFDGINGERLVTGSSPQEYALRIKCLFDDQELYSRVSMDSRTKFNEVLNWDVVGEKMTKYIFEVMKNRK